ncbi:MAG TPA: hypothetical protein VGR35_18535 [Tepidisphaeraceae bacterium]|nr:hypothetical protein [Tepidisphaeraceae bacterium]
MRALLSLIWKEYREQRWFLIAALVIFCGFPLLEATGRYFQPPKQYTTAGVLPGKPEFYYDSAGGLVIGLGGLLAIFVAIGSTTRDLRDELHVFWRSRPVSPGLWLTVKYLTGLATVLLACTLPMLMQFAMAAHTGRFWSVREVGHAVGIHSFTLVLLFSVAFLLGCLVRHATNAALLAAAAGLVLYFLPVVAAPLAPLSVFSLINDDALLLERNVTPKPAGWDFVLPFSTTWRVLIEPRDWSIFVAAMLGGSIAAAGLALVAVRRDWRLAADRQAMHWSLGGVALLLFGATAFQVGSNLKVKQQIDFPGSNLVIGNFHFNGQRGVALLREMRKDGRWSEHVTAKLCTVEIAPDGLRYGPPVGPSERINVPVPWEPDMLFWRPEYPDRAYLLAQRTDTEEKNGEPTVVVAFRTLVTFDLTGASPDPIIHRLDIGPAVPLQARVRGHRIGDAIYIDGDDRTVVITLADPDAPAVKQVLQDRSDPPYAMLGPGVWGRRQVFPTFQKLHEQTDAAGRVSVGVYLTQVGDLAPRELLEATLALAWSNDRFTLAGDLLVRADREGISTYRLVSVDSTKGRFELLGRCAFTPLERLMGSHMVQLTVVGDQLYARGRGLTVYDLSDPANPRRAGHFAPGTRTGTEVVALTSGDVLIAADRMYILEPPRVLE